MGVLNALPSENSAERQKKIKGSTRVFARPDQMARRLSQHFVLAICRRQVSLFLGRRCLRDFLTDDLDVDDMNAPKLSAKELEDMCTIRVEIVQTFRVGRCQHKKSSTTLERSEQGKLNPIIQENCQPAKYGLSTG